MPEVEAMAKAEGERWNREGRLALWFLDWLPLFVASGVQQGIAAAFNENGSVTMPSMQQLLDSIPDYRKDDNDG